MVKFFLVKKEEKKKCPFGIQTRTHKTQQAVASFMTTSEIVLMRLLEQPDLGHSTNSLWGHEGKKEKKKAQHPAGFEPMTPQVLAPEHVLYHCATATASSKL